MRKTMIAIAVGLTAVVAAACGGSGASSSPGTMAPVESPSDVLGSPSDMLESPSDMLESPSAS